MADQIQKTPDLELVTKDDLIFDIELKNEDGTAKDITGWTASWIFRKTLKDDPSDSNIVLTGVITAAAGKITFDLTRELNNLSAVSTWYSQLRLVEPGGDNGLRTTLRPGTVKVYPCLFEN